MELTLKKGHLVRTKMITSIERGIVLLFYKLCVEKTADSPTVLLGGPGVCMIPVC